jgi:hypothetical protein
MRLTTRLRFALDVEVVEVERGALLRAPAGQFTVQGGAAYRLIQKLRPILDGSKSINEILSLVNPEARSWMLRIIDELIVRGVLLKGRPPESSSGFLQQLSFLDECGGNAHARFGQFRRSPVLVIGSSPVARSLARASADIGVGKLIFVADSELIDSRQSFESATHYPTMTIEHVKCSSERIATAAIAILVQEKPDLIDLRRNLAACREADVAVVPIFTWGSFGAVGPINAAHAGPCAECLLQQVQLPFRTQPELSYSSSAILAHVAISKWFVHRTKAISADASDLAFSIGPEPFSSATHRLVRCPTCSSCSPNVGRYFRFKKDGFAPSDFTSAIFGPIRELSAESKQSPLAVVETTVIPTHSRSRQRYRGFGVNVRHAELSAVNLAAEALAASAARQVPIPHRSKRLLAFPRIHFSKGDSKIASSLDLRRAVFAAGTTCEEARARAIFRYFERRLSPRAKWMPLLLPLGDEELSYIGRLIEREFGQYVVEHSRFDGFICVRTQAGTVIGTAVHAELKHAHALSMARTLIRRTSTDFSRDFGLDIDANGWRQFWQKCKRLLLAGSVPLIVGDTDFYPELEQSGLSIAFAFRRRQ